MKEDNKPLSIEQLADWLYQKFQEYGVYNCNAMGEIHRPETKQSANNIAKELQAALSVKGEATALPSLRCSFPNAIASEDALKVKAEKVQPKIENGKSEFHLGWRLCYEWLEETEATQEEVQAKELPEIAELDRVINTYVHSHAHGNAPYHHIQRTFWKAVEKLQDFTIYRK